MVLEERYAQTSQRSNLLFNWTGCCRDRTGSEMLFFKEHPLHRLDLHTGQMATVHFPENRPHTVAW